MSVIQRASDFVSCVLLAVEVVYIFIVIHALTMVAVRSKALAIYFFFVILCLSILSFISHTSSFVCLFFFCRSVLIYFVNCTFFLHNFHTAAKYAVLLFIKPVSNYLFQVSLPKVTLGILLCQEVFFNFKVTRFCSWI